LSPVPPCKVVATALVFLLARPLACDHWSDDDIVEILD